MVLRVGASMSLVVASAVTASMLVGLGALAFNGPDDRSGRVVRVIDGDTLIAEVSGDDVTVRLLNIDTPETKDPSEPVQCMGPEATDFLAARLPAGAEIELEYDVERTDKYGRTLAGVYESDSLINAEIAAAGMGIPVVFEPNQKLYPQVLQAYDGAVSAGRGLFDPAIDCTLPHQIEDLAAQAEQIPTEPGADPTAAVSEAQQTVDAVDGMVALLDDPSALEGAGHWVLSGEVTTPVRTSMAGRLLVIRSDAQRRAATLQRAIGEGEGAVQSAAPEPAGTVPVADDAGRASVPEADDASRGEDERDATGSTAVNDRSTTEKQSSDEADGTDSQKPEDEPTTKESSPKKEAAKKTPEAPTDKSTKKASKKDASTEETPREKEPVEEPVSEKTSSAEPEEKPRQKESVSSGDSGSCVPYGPEYPYEKYGGPPYSGKRYGMPGGKTYRRCQ